MSQRLVHGLVVLVAGLSAWLFAAHYAPMAAAASAEPAHPVARHEGLDALMAAAQAGGQVRVIVGLDMPEFRPERMGAAAGAAAEQAAIAAEQAALLSRMHAHPPTNVTAWDFIPFMAMTVDAAGLDALAADPQVASLTENFTLELNLSTSVNQIGAHNSHTLLYRGQGQTVAILDTGIDKFHPDLAGKVVSEACYSGADSGFTSLCPGGASSSTAINSALACANTITGCHHGTHVAGIVAGVAPDASLISIQVFSRVTSGCAHTSPCTLSTVADVISGLNRVYNLRNSYNIAAVNMSLGAGQYISPCNSAGFLPGINAVTVLRAAGITVVAAAGNDSYRFAMGWPACLPGVLSVGSVTKSNQLSDFSNVANYTTLLAPGSDIYSTFPTAYGVNHATRSGTSMAAPHVAGALALLRNARPQGTPDQLTNALINTGTLVADNRPGGTVSKRAINVWAATCSLITCDADDFRTLPANSTLSGSINPFSDVDHYYYHGQAGQRLTLRMNRTSGTVDPYLELISPSGFRVALNDNGGGGVNALINGYLLPQTGFYRIRARGVGSGTGSYSVSASHTVETLNPVPSISRLSPASATGTPFGSDFWVAIYGSNFTTDSQVRWNGQLRAKYYSSPTLIYIRVLGSDIGFPWPRLAFVTVSNPAPGGGTSNSYAFNIADPFLGETELLAPPSGSSLATGVQTTMVISWTHPTESWRDMQNLDVILRNDEGETAMWLRVSEETTLTVSLLNSSGTPVISTTMLSGQQGLGPDLVISDTVTLHTDQTLMAGSGMTLIISPTLSFGPNAVGTWNIEFTVDSADGEIQDDDVLGTLIIHPPGCPTPLQDVSVSGPSTGFVGLANAYTAAISPGGATGPVAYLWAPEPDSGQGTPNATYTFTEAAEHAVSVMAENCGGFAAAAQSVFIATGNDPDLALTKSGPPVAVAGEVLTYTLQLANRGALTATSVVISDVLPAGAHFVAAHFAGGSGNLAGNTVTWNLPGLSGYGTITTTTLVITATSSITNAAYSASASGVATVAGSPPVATKLVDDHAPVTPVLSATLSYASAQRTSSIHIPDGTVFQDLIAAYEELSNLPALPSPGTQFAGRVFKLDVYEAGPPAAQLAGALSGFEFGDAISLSLTFAGSDVAGMDASRLRVHYWDGAAWTRAGLWCHAVPLADRVDCTFYNARTGIYALFETPVWEVFLPLTLRD
jgi:uncharacterized repeat protein (TIGR01451 family)